MTEDILRRLGRLEEQQDQALAALGRIEGLLPVVTQASQENTSRIGVLERWQSRVTGIAVTAATVVSLAIQLLWDKLGGK